MYDKEGGLWLFYGSWSGGIALLKLDNQTGLRDLDYNYGYTELGNDGAVWEGTSLVYDPYMGIHIAGGWWVSGEGPYVEYIDGYYYLFMSYRVYRRILLPLHVVRRLRSGRRLQYARVPF